MQDRRDRKIRKLDKILDDVRNYLSLKSKDKDADYIARQTHFVTLEELIKKKEFDEARKHIENGIKQFSQIFFTSRYYSFLSELKLNLTTENTNDELSRINKLTAAIISKDADKVNNALQNGCLAVINTPYQPLPGYSTGITQGKTPIEIAMSIDAVNVFTTLLANHVTLQKDNYRLLHFAAKHGLYRQIALNFSKENLHKMLNVVDEKGQTALWLAIKNNQTTTAKQLLKLGADPNITPKGELFNLFHAIHNKNEELVSALLKKNVKIDRSSYYLARQKSKANAATEEDKAIFSRLYEQAKLPLKHHKTKIIGGKHSLLFTRPAPSFELVEKDPILWIKSQIYSKDPSVDQALINQLTETYKSDPILQPLLTIVGLGSVGMRANATKPLKTILDVGTSNVGHLVVDSHDSGGVYTGKSSVYAADVKGYTLGIMLHEWKHFTDREVFNSNGEMKLTVADQKTYDKVREDVKKQIANFPADNDVLRTIKGSFTAVFDGSYSARTVDYELLARVPEVLGALGVEQGKKWLQDNTPSLLNFYQKEYNTYLTNHIQIKRNEYAQQVMTTNEIKPKV